MSRTADGECLCTWARVWHDTSHPGVTERSWTITDYTVGCPHHDAIARAIAWAAPAGGSDE